MSTFHAAPVEVLALLAETMRIHHQDLTNLGVTVAVVMAEADVDENGDPKGDAIVVRKKAAWGKIKITPPELRVLGVADAQMMLDGDRWVLLSREEQMAVIDHELTHLEPTGDIDDGGRPKLKLREHDIEVGWFEDVAERHGEHSQERQQARQLASSSVFKDIVIDNSAQVELALTPKIGKALRALQKAAAEAGIDLVAAKKG